MAFDIGAVVGHVKLNTQDFKKGSSFVKDQIRSLTKGFSVLAGIALFKNIIKETNDFNVALANVSTLVDTNIVDMGQMRDGILSMAGSLGSAKELTDGLYQAISASVDPAKAIEFVGDAALFAKAALVDVNTAVDVITTGLNAYGFSAEYATQVSDELFQVIKLGKTNGAELAGVIGQSIPLAANMGIAFKELGATIAIMTRQGIGASEATTQFNAVVNAFLKPTDKLAQAVKKLGYESGSAAIKELGFKKALDLVVESADGSNEALAKMFNNSRAGRGVMALTGEGAKDFAEVLDEVGNSAGSTSEAADKQEVTFADLSDTINKTMIVMGQRLMPTIYDVAKALTKFFDELSKNTVLIGALDAAAGILSFTLETVLGIVSALTHDSMEWAREQKALNENIKVTGVVLRETAKSVDDWKAALKSAITFEDKTNLSIKELKNRLKIADEAITTQTKKLKAYETANVSAAGALDIFNKSSDMVVGSEQEKADAIEKEKDELNKLIAARQLLAADYDKANAGEFEAASERIKIREEFHKMTMDQSVAEIAEINKQKEAYIKAGVTEVEAKKWAAGEIAKIRKDAIEKEKADEAERVQAAGNMEKYRIDQEMELGKSIETARDEAHNAELSRITEEQAAREQLMSALYDTSMSLYGGLQGLAGTYFDYQLSQYDKDSEEYKRVKKEQFEVNKWFNAINTGIAGAAGAVEAYKSLAGIPIIGPALGIAAATAMGAFTLAQVGFIMAQEMPAMEKGGVGRGLAIVGEAGPEIVNLGSTSRVIPADETAELMGRSSGMTMNNTFYVNNQSDAELVTRKLGQRFQNARRRI
jgi:TP901 family phage tail tape measure protein